jgi:hypothetical protein
MQITLTFLNMYLSFLINFCKSANGNNILFNSSLIEGAKGTIILFSFSFI